MEARPRAGDGSPATAPAIDPAVYGRRWWILAVLCLSLVLVVAANASLNVALPTLSRELDASQTELQWLVDAYAIVFAGLLLLAGALGDRFGRKGALQAGLAVFGLGAILASRADTATAVIACRALMGAGAAFVMPSTLSLLAAAFPPRERARAIAIWAGFAGAGAGLGTVTSGVLLEHFGWSSVFLINVPIIVVALVAGAVLVPSSRDTRGRPLDPVGAGLSIIGLGSLVFGIIEGPSRGWSSPGVVAGLVVGILAIGALLVWEARAPNPMIDLHWFRDRRFSIGASTITLTFFATFGLFFVLTQYLQFVLGYSPLQAGLATLPMSVAIILSAPRSARLVERWGPQRVVGTGLLGFVAAFLLLSRVQPTTGYALLAVALVLVGICAGMVMPPSTGQIMTALPLDKAGVGSAINDTTREVGGALGIAVLGSVLSSVYRQGLGDLATALPPTQRHEMQSSVGAGLALAARSDRPGPAIDIVREAFTTAAGRTFLVAAGVTLLNAAVVWALAPRRAMVHAVRSEAAPQPSEV